MRPTTTVLLHRIFYMNIAIFLRDFILFLAQKRQCQVDDHALSQTESSVQSYSLQFFIYYGRLFYGFSSTKLYTLLLNEDSLKL